MNTYGNLYKISIFGESHGQLIGVVISGCPSGISLSEEDFSQDLARRKSGNKGTTPRIESDLPSIVSGVFNGKTTGTPLTIVFENANTKSKDYSNLVTQPRPGHADFVANKKYLGFNDYTGGGHFSGRITLGIVAAGVVAKKILSEVSIQASIAEVGGCKEYDKVLDEAIKNKDSLGGIVQCSIKGLPIGYGEPFFYSVESEISRLAFSIPSIKGIEFGAGFEVAKLKGSQNNDCLIDNKGTTQSNNAGGIVGGISNGNEINFRVAVKPTSSIGLAQKTFNFESQKVSELKIEGRHDACIALRVPVIIEAISAIALADLHFMKK